MKEASLFLNSHVSIDLETLKKVIKIRLELVKGELRYKIICRGK